MGLFMYSPLHIASVTIETIYSAKKRLVQPMNYSLYCLTFIFFHMEL